MLHHRTGDLVISYSLLCACRPFLRPFLVTGAPPVLRVCTGAAQARCHACAVEAEGGCLQVDRVLWIAANLRCSFSVEERSASSSTFLFSSASFAYMHAISTRHA